MTELASSADTVHVACCFDQKMELPFLVLAGSLERHLKSDRKVVLHAFHADPIGHPAYFLAFKSATFELRLRPIEKRAHDASTWPGYLTAATLLRLTLPSLLQDIDRIIYLDCDLVVLSDITTLYDTDVSDLPLAACLDFWLSGAPPFAPPGWPVEEWHIFLHDVVGLADHKAYFNAGVMVMDLERFRSNGLIEAAERFLEQRNYRTAFVDQDALNHVINGAFVRLDSRWNVLGNRSTVAVAAPGPNFDPRILHFAGPYKPWNCEAQRASPWNRRFWQEAAQSAVLPLLVQTYLESCERRGLTRLQSAGVLLSSGKPGLHKQDILAHAQKYQAFPKAAQASETIARNLDRRPESIDGAATLISVDVLSHDDGVRDGNNLIFDLKAADGYIVFGPSLWYPAGAYEAIFILAVANVAPDQTNKLVIDIVDGAGGSLAQRLLTPLPSATEHALNFVIDRNELFLAFRVFATGFAAGELRFGGIALRALSTS